jgi:hypothetical protein
MNEKVLLVDRNGKIKGFYLESPQDKDFVIIAERPTGVRFGEAVDVREPLPIKKKIFKFHHFGPTSVPVYHEVRE